VPAPQGRTDTLTHLSKGVQARKFFSHPCLSFLLVLSLSLFVSFASILPQVLLFFIIINYDLHLRPMHTWCLHLSRSSLLRKTRTVNLCQRTDALALQLPTHAKDARHWNPIGPYRANLKLGDTDCRIVHEIVNFKVSCLLISDYYTVQGS